MAACKCSGCGIPGPRGADGAPGPQGIPGPTGPQGPDGSALAVANHLAATDPHGDRAFIANAWLLPSLKSWTYSEAFSVTSIVRDSATGVAVSANVTWPDGGTGVYTVDILSTRGTVDAYHITYVNGSVSKTITQPAVTRDTSGAVTVQPALVIV